MPWLNVSVHDFPNRILSTSLTGQVFLMGRKHRLSYCYRFKTLRSFCKKQDALRSNAPSVVVLEPLRAAVSVPVIGVFPPVRDAIACSKSANIAVLGVRSMITSVALRAYVDRNRPASSQVLLVDASSLVDLVENFTFILDHSGTQAVVTNFISNLRSLHPNIDVMTMSSTHLPWLKSFFESAAPDLVFLDPADTVLDELAPHLSIGEGRTHCVATETAELSSQAFNLALRSLGTQLQATLKRL